MTKVIVAIGVLAVLFCGQSTLLAQASDDATGKVVKESKDEGSANKEAKKEKVKEAYDSKMDSHREAMMERAGDDPAKQQKVEQKLEQEGEQHKENMIDRAKESNGQATDVDQTDPAMAKERASLESDLEAKRKELKTKAGDDPEAQERARKEYEQYKANREEEFRSHMNHDGNRNENMTPERMEKQKARRDQESTNAGATNKKVKKAGKTKPKE